MESQPQGLGVVGCMLQGHQTGEKQGAGSVWGAGGEGDGVAACAEQPRGVLSEHSGLVSAVMEAQCQK